MTQPLHLSCHQRSFLMSSGQASLPPCGNRKDSYLWGKGKGWSHSLQSLNVLLQPGMAKILLAPESAALKSQPPRKGTE